MSKREASLKGQAMQELIRRCPGFLILRVADAGGPDRMVVGRGRVTFWEFKHGTPNFTSHGIQELFCMRLARECHCRYVIWQEHRGVQRTLIVHPTAVHARVGWQVVPEASCPGFDHGWLAEQIGRMHEG